MSKYIVFEGWLTKSPPSKRIWRMWRRRWFALRQSGELPGQYFLDYYADRNCRRLKGTINLDLCEQVDAGLRMERSGNGTLDTKIRGSVFTIQTNSRTYHLEADCEADMEKWVDAICRVCGLRATKKSENELDAYQNEHYDCSDSNGPYIPISECVTGVRVQDTQRAFSFDPADIANTRTPYIASEGKDTMDTSQPHIKMSTVDLSENESNLSEDDCKSWTNSHSNKRDWIVAESFTKLAINIKENSEHGNGPPVPPRPPKTLTMKRVQNKNRCRDAEVALQIPRILEPENHDGISHSFRTARRSSPIPGPPSPARPLTTVSFRVNPEVYTDSEDHPSLQYCNLPSLAPQTAPPPAVDRALKPRHSTHNLSYIGQGLNHSGNSDEGKPNALCYLDLDLPTSNNQNKLQRSPRKKRDIEHGKLSSTHDAYSPYKSVDFAKTEAFNITRKDTEASRSIKH